MRQLRFYPIAVFTACLLHFTPAFSQFNVKITVLGGSATTTCTDIIGFPDPMWSVNIANTGWVRYPKTGTCFGDLPNVQFDSTFQCLADIPPAIQVCFRAFENDPNPFVLCDVFEACVAEICVNVPIPTQGSNNVTIQLPDNLPSDGEVNLNITTSGFPGGFNDHVCNAIDAGILPSGGSLGNADSSLFNNYCATNTGEPNPGFSGAGWLNNRAVWFKFSTGSNPGTHFLVKAKSDPDSLGDPVNLQIALYTTSDNTCTGNFNFVTHSFTPANWDESMLVVCPQPNTAYYIMVDAVWDTPEELEGIFGLQITELGVQSAPDLRCSAHDLGAVPLGNEVSSGLRTNACSSNANALPVTSFQVQKSVWFAFQPPPTGHVTIDVASETANDPIGVQLAVFRSSTGDCNGVFSEIASSYTANNLDESLELHCLDPTQTYYLMVDGTSSNLITGIFNVTISDAGDETPVNNQNVMICAGESLQVGSSTYSQSGIYADTLEYPNGCDSIVNTNLTVLTPLVLNFSIVQQGLGVGNTDGMASVAPTGGSGGYTFAWSDGQSIPLASGLVGGDNYCVTVTDLNGCSADTCFTMPYFLHFNSNITPDTLKCFGDQDGELRLTVANGLPPYQYTWQNSTNTISGSGTILADGDEVLLQNLPAGTYSFHIVDIYFDTTISVEIVQPALLEIATATVADAACFSECNGSVQVVIAGGTAPYATAWSNGATGITASNLCAGSYQVTITDANGCTGVFDYQVNQPDQFIATASEVQPVSCFEGTDGIASVTTNGTPAAYVWDNGATTASNSDLPGGIYFVTVTNTDGCTATASVEVLTPDAPVSVSIQELNSIVCKGDDNGVLQANVNGPGTGFTYLWSSGSTFPTAQQLPAGDYSVTVANQNGCSATADFQLTEPAEIQAVYTPNQLSCLDPLDGGVITVESVSGGVEPYQFSTDGVNFGPDAVLDGYFAGNQTFYVKDAGGCVRNFSTVIEGPGELLVELGSDKSIQLGESLKLDANANQTEVTYAWTPAEVLSCSDCASPEVLPLESGTFSVTVTDDFGCTATDEIFVEVTKRRNVYVPNVFSPNGDGFNDEFVPYGGTDVAVIKVFKIFDRQGNLVFSADNLLPGDLNQGWDGTFKGKEMQPAVFVWFGEFEFIDGVVQQYKGDVTLMK